MVAEFPPRVLPELPGLDSPARTELGAAGAQRTEWGAKSAAPTQIPQPSSGVLGGEGRDRDREAGWVGSVAPELQPPWAPGPGCSSHWVAAAPGGARCRMGWGFLETGAAQPSPPGSGLRNGAPGNSAGLARASGRGAGVSGPLSLERPVWRKGFQLQRLDEASSGPSLGSCPVLGWVGTASNPALY